MSSFWMMVAIILPVLGGAVVALVKFPTRKVKCIYIEVIALITSLIVLMLLLNRPTEPYVLFSFTGNMKVQFLIDGLGSIFTAIIAFLWPLCTLYSFEYMEKEQHENVFFFFYLATYGVTLGISMANNMVSLYMFYEMLTLVTMPLILHTLTREAVLATRTYLVYSIGGAAFAFIGMVFLLVNAANPNFVYGGSLLSTDMQAEHFHLFLILYVLTFMGFGVKAAVWPLSKWLPMAGVAPTPVTGLLHAVAVVNSGAFAMMRLTYYCYDPDCIKGSWAQYLLMAIAIITIVYGCSKAVKERHLKRRLANSTVGNLSYMVFGITLMTPLGLAGALMHFICHSFMKISSFFCAGAIIHKSEKHYVYELDGLGRKMPKVFAIFTISSLALMGVPLLAGFVSKYALANAAISSGEPLAYVGLGALLVSALLTAIYMMTIVVRAYFPEIIQAVEYGRNEDILAALIMAHDYKNGIEADTEEEITDPSFRMLLPLTVFTIMIIALGVYSKPVWDYVMAVAFNAL